MREEGGDGGGDSEAEGIILVRGNWESKSDFDFVAGWYDYDLQRTIYLSDLYFLFKINSPDGCGLVFFSDDVIVWVKWICDLLIFNDVTIIVFGTLEVLLQSDILRIYDN